jgi:DNA-binding protein YbaB
MTGGFELRALKIDPQCVDLKDLGMLQDLVIAAVNQAIEKAQAMVQAHMAKVAGGFGVPGMNLPGF